MFGLTFTTRSVLAAALTVLAIGLGGCDDEPAQRRAFITFLQTRIIDKPGLHIPIMSDEDIKNLGPYADQYRIMNGFHHRMNDAVSKDMQALQASQPRSIEELVARRAMLPVLQTAMTHMQSEIDKARAEADAAHNALHQPADLKVVYDTAYDHMVALPADTMRELAVSVQQDLPVLKELAAYLDEHRRAISYRDGVPMTNDAKVRGELEPLMRSAVAVAQRSEEGKRKLRKMSEGY
ncbi:MAG TPA: DUF3053 family protein [Pseudolabrys sp.]|nr:DUF3053 family protein [Pseudolabrys sp.]